MLMDATNAHLLVVDIQERLLPAMAEPAEVVANARISLAAAAALGVPVTVSEQYPAGLGHTVSELRDATGNEVHAKTEFSCLANPAIADRVAALDRRQLVVIGLEAHVCVLQSALDARLRGLDVFVVADAVGSRKAASREHALQRLRDEGVRVVTTEMIVFEWLRDARSPQFRALSQLVR
jgi:nicotinamidase-related amidase